MLCNKKETANVKKRIKRLAWILLAGFLVIIFRLWYLQLIKGNQFRDRAKSNRIRLIHINAQRGRIYDRYKNILVKNVRSFNVLAVPNEIKDIDATVKLLSETLGLEQAFITRKLCNLSHKGYSAIKLASNISLEKVTLIEERSSLLPGIFIQIEPRRKYILGESAAYITGHVRQIRKGEIEKKQYHIFQYNEFKGEGGVEEAFDNLLKGSDGGKQIEVNSRGEQVALLVEKKPERGSNIILAIDKHMQEFVSKLLEDKTGTIIVMDPQNGDILAMAGSPSYDPDIFNAPVLQTDLDALEKKDAPLLNRAVSALYAPGSIFKILMVGAGLKHNVVTYNQKLECEGHLKIGKDILYCWDRAGHGSMNMSDAIRDSCDVYFYRLGLKLGIDRIADFADACGLGKLTGIKLPGEKSGLLPDKNWRKKRPWYSGDTALLSIGQSYLLVTPIQLVSLISAVANGGIIYRPRILSQTQPEQIGKLPCSKETIRQIKKALCEVVSDKGTGKFAQVKGLEIAGKTSTVQVVKMRHISKYKDIPYKFRDHAMFVAFAPVKNPQIALVVIVEHGGEGGKVAAPIAKQIFKWYIKNRNGKS
ncbi:penicillin-binding protein 2 [bacterium]|nr:penicillin-binding protein 2 [bacterium]